MDRHFQLKKHIHIAIKEHCLREGYISKLKDIGYVNNILDRLDIKGYKIVDSGQHGIIVSLSGSEKCLKLTESKAEKSIVEKIGRQAYATLPTIYKQGQIDTIFWYERDFFTPISEALADAIDENMDEIYDFFDERKNWDVEKSNSNLSYEFDGKFLSFLSQLKRDLHKIGLLPFNWDIDGLSTNTYNNKNGSSFVLADF